MYIEQYKLFLILMVGALILCIIGSILKKTVVIIVCLVLAILFGLRSGLLYLALGYEPPNIQEEIEDLDLPKVENKLELPKINYHIDKDAIGFGLDGIVDGAKKTIKHDTDVLTDGVEEAINNMTGKSERKEESPESDTVLSDTETEAPAATEPVIEEQTETTDQETISTKDNVSSDVLNEEITPEPAPEPVSAANTANDTNVSETKTE